MNMPHISISLAHVPLSVRLVQEMGRIRKNITPALLQKTRIHIADSIGIALAARKQSDIAGNILCAQRLIGGAGNSRVFGGGSLSVASAAFMNSSLIHILDYDDIYDMGRLHPTVVTLPAALAAQSVNQASDEVLTQAVLLGNELICRLGKVFAPQGNGPGSDWFLTQLFGYIAATYAAATVLDLSEEQTVSAIGLAYMQTAGGKQAGFGIGSNARAIYPAFAAQAGIQSALLARSGMIGPSGALDGDAGLLRIYLGLESDDPRIEQLYDHNQWTLQEVEVKPWPACRLSHPYVSLASQCRDHFSGRVDDLKFKITINASAAKLCRPLDQRRTPSTLQDAKYSIPFMTAFTLAHGEPTLNNLNEASLTDDVTLSLARRIDISEDLPDAPGHPPATLEAISTDGSGSILFKFDPQHLFTSEQGARKKFFDCLSACDLGSTHESVWEHLMHSRVSQALDEIDAGGSLRLSDTK